MAKLREFDPAVHFPHETGEPLNSIDLLYPETHPRTEAQARADLFAAVGRYHDRRVDSPDFNDREEALHAAIVLARTERGDGE